MAFDTDHKIHQHWVHYIQQHGFDSLHINHFVHGARCARRRKAKEANIAGNIRKRTSASYSLATSSRTTHIKHLNDLENNLTPTPSSRPSSLRRDFSQQRLLQKRVTFHTKQHNYLVGLGSMALQRASYNRMQKHHRRSWSTPSRQTSTYLQGCHLRLTTSSSSSCTTSGKTSTACHKVFPSDHEVFKVDPEVVGRCSRFSWLTS